MKKPQLLFCFLLSFIPVQSMAGQWSAGAISLLQTSPYSGGEGGINVFPIVAYEGERFVWRGPFADYYLVGGQRTKASLSISVGLAPNQLDVDNDPQLAGIEDRNNSFLGGLRYNTALWQGRFSISLATDLTNEHQGQRAVVRWQRPVFAATDRRWQVQAGAEVEYLTSNYTNFYFGISQQEAVNSPFRAYTPGSVVQPSILVNGYYRLSKRWQIIANLGWQFLANELKDSPIVDQSGVPTGLLGITYNF